MSAFTRFIFWSALAHVALSRRTDKDVNLAHGQDLNIYVTVSRALSTGFGI